MHSNVRVPARSLWSWSPYEGGLRDVMPGSKCIANAYTNNHDWLSLAIVGPLRNPVPTYGRHGRCFTRGDLAYAGAVATGPNAGVRRALSVKPRP